MELLFAQELPDAGMPASIRRPIARKLINKGYVETSVRTVGRDSLGPITVNVYQLTVAGHYRYCEEASKMVLSEEQGVLRGK
jgi:hypothetical protein